MQIKLGTIKISEKDPAKVRVRKNFGNLERLADSIKRNGLIQPIVVDNLDEAPFLYVLIAGERRLRAMSLLGRTEIDATLRSDVDDITRKEIELEENIFRKELDWKEEAQLTAQIDELKRRRHGAAVKGHAGGWGLQQTADSIGASIGKVSQDIMLAKAMEDNEIALRVSHLPRQAAVKVVRQLVRARTLAQGVAERKIILSSDLRLGSCVDLIKQLPDASVHLVLTDPPFSGDMIQKVAASGSYNECGTNVSNDDTMVAVFKQLIPELARVLVPGGHIYMFFGMHLYEFMTSLLRSVGFHIDVMPLIWDKLQVSIGGKDMHYMSCYEPILYGYKHGEPKRLLWKPVPNVLKFQAIPGQMRVHPLQKPTALLQMLIENSSSIGETVLDPFAGSAATLVEARRLQRSAVGFEIDQDNYLRAQDFMQRSEQH